LAVRPLGAAWALACAAVWLLPVRVEAFEHSRLWSLGVWGGFATASASDINRRVDLDNLAFASAIPHIDSFHEAGGDLRYDLDQRLSIEGRFSYWWKNQSNGRFDRKVSAIPAALGITWRPIVSERWRLGGTGAAGLVFGAGLSGSDPLGGIDFSGTGPLVEGGIDAEFAFSRSGSLEGRGLARWAVAKDVLPEGGDVNLSGVSVRVGLRLYFQPRRSSVPGAPS
jgi:hypothetical protein